MELSTSSFVIPPSPSTCAKSLTLRSRRLTIRGVPRERRAISEAAAASSFVRRRSAETQTVAVQEERLRTADGSRG